MQQPRASATHPTPGYRRRAADVVVLVVAGLVLAASWAMMGRADRVAQGERAVFHAINDLPGWLRTPIEPLMQLGWFGTVLIVAVGAVLVGFVSHHPRRGAVAAMAVGPAGAGAYLLARVAKHMVGRGRPGNMLNEVKIRGSAASGLGFPSGHAAVSMALVLVVLPYLLWRWALLALPLIVALARVYVGAHLPLDVVAGAGIGALAASVMNLAIGVPPLPVRVVVPPKDRPAAVEEPPTEPIPPPEEALLGAPR